MKRTMTGKRMNYIVMALMLSCLMFCTSRQEVQAASSAETMADVSVKLLRQASRTGDPDRNILISPDSILTAMTLAEYGAAGKTLSEMQSAFNGISLKKQSSFLEKLHSRVSSSGVFTYSAANSVWYRKGLVSLRRKYASKMKKGFGAEIISAPFDTGTVTDMNAWVSEKTRGKITKIVDQLSPSDRVVLLNAVYFNGKWTAPYRSVQKRVFTGKNGKKKKVPMLESVEQVYVKICGADGFIKPYKGGKAAFMALLPPKGEAIGTWLKKLTGAQLIKGYRNRVKSGIVVRTRLPKLSYDDQLSLKKPLQKMGIREAFSLNADFSKMSGSEIHIDDVLHKTHIDVDESGTEAAAVTAVVMKANAVFPAKPQIIKKVYLNRPFVYAIIDTQTGMPLFMGIVNGF